MMTVPRGNNIERCNLCDTKLCTFIIIFKWIWACAFCNFYSKRWERSLPPARKAEQRKKQNNIHFYQALTVFPVFAHLILTWDYYGFNGKGILNTLISIAGSIVYLFTFWYVIQGREEFKVINRAWHSGREREPYSKIRMPEHLKFIVIVILAAEIFGYLIIGQEVGWFLATVLHFSSCYFFLDSNIVKLFPQNRNGNNEVIYKIE